MTQMNRIAWFFSLFSSVLDKHAPLKRKLVNKPTQSNWFVQIHQRNHFHKSKDIINTDYGDKTSNLSFVIPKLIITMNILTPNNLILGSYGIVLRNFLVNQVLQHTLV